MMLPALTEARSCCAVSTTVTPAVRAADDPVQAVVVPADAADTPAPTASRSADHLTVWDEASVEFGVHTMRMLSGWAATASCGTAQVMTENPCVAPSASWMTSYELGAVPI